MLSHGTTLEIVLGISDNKLWKCQVCQLSHADLEAEGKTGLCLDHDHLGIKGGKACVRGALCNSCNVGLGVFGGTIKSMMDLKDAIIAYLESPPGRTYDPDFTLAESIV